MPSPSWLDFGGKSAVSCLQAFNKSKSNFYGFWISSWDINGRGRSNNDASKNESSVSLETPQNSTHWKEAFLKALESPSFLHSVNGKWNHSLLGFEMLLQLLHTWAQDLPGASWPLCTLVADGQQRQEKGKAELKSVPNKVWKAIFEIQLPERNRKQHGNPGITR